MRSLVHATTAGEALSPEIFSSEFRPRPASPSMKAFGLTDHP